MNSESQGFNGEVSLTMQPRTERNTSDHIRTYRTVLGQYPHVPLVTMKDTTVMWRHKSDLVLNGTDEPHR